MPGGWCQGIHQHRVSVMFLQPASDGKQGFVSKYDEGKDERNLAR